MKATLLSKEGNEVKFEIEWSAEEFGDAIVNAYKANKDKFQIDGFRKGKAPRSIIEQRYGEGVFYDDAIDELLQKGYPEALGELDIEPIDKPALDLGEIKKGEAFKVVATAQVAPEVEVKDYTGLKVKNVEYPVTDEEIDKHLEAIQARNARLVDTDKAAEEGDTVNIDYSGSVDGEKFEGGTDEGFNLKIGSKSFIEGFEEQLVGKKKGDEVSVEVTFPAEYHAEALAGKPAVFEVKVNEVKVEEKPELNDEFAQDISEFNTLEEYRADVEKKLIEYNENRVEMELRDQILEQIYEANDVDVPDAMVDDQINDMIGQYEQELQQQGMGIQQYLQYVGQTIDDFKENLKDDAYKTVKTRLLISSIARIEGFEATEEDVDAELEKIAEAYSIEKDKIAEIIGEYQVKLLKQDIKNRKAVDYVYETAVVEK
jgi:trigger factor